MHSPANAASVPVDQVIRELQPQTDLPIWMPETVPSMDRVYTSVDSELDSPYLEGSSYSINFDYTAGCNGSTACNYGYFSAVLNGQFTTAADIINPQRRGDIPPDKIVPVRLVDGMSGQFVNTCGAHCTARVEWRLGSVLYYIAVKNGTQADTVALANAILQGGVRATGTASSPSTSEQTIERVFISASEQTKLRIVQNAGWEQSGATIGNYQQQDGSGGYLVNTGRFDPMGFYTLFYDTSGSEQCTGQMHIYIDDGGFSYGSRTTWTIEDAVEGYACSTVGQTFELNMQQTQ